MTAAAPTTQARRTLAVCGLTAGGELACLAATTVEWSNFTPAGLVLLLFTLGPPAFVAVAVWRRRAHPRRSVLFFRLAVVVAVLGLGYLGRHAVRYHADPEYRTTRTVNPVLIPFTQWVLVLMAWAPVVVREGREKQAGRPR